MKTIFLNLFVILCLFPHPLLSQISISGEFRPNAMFRISDGSLINLPLRLGTLSMNYSMGDFEFISSTALETRWKDARYDHDMLQFREAYILWYPRFGEVKLGKMIQAWGAADANNPTDNLTPYDFYYMFMSGTDRKLGNLGLSAKIYLRDWQVEAIYTPKNKAARLPFGEPDFPIEFPFEPSTYVSVTSPAEFGFRVQNAFNAADMSISVLRSHDQLFSLLALEGEPGVSMLPHFGYRNTDIFGFDFVAFPGNWTVRGEGGFFRTTSPETEYLTRSDSPDYRAIVYDVEAQYLQYVVQVEYQFANQITLMAQFLGTEVTKAEGHTFPRGSFGFTKLTKENFVSGLGTPFALISDQVIIFSSFVTLFDNSVEMRAMEMINLEETGSMTSIGGSYTLSDGLRADATLIYFLGGDEEGNSFKELEDFSNLSLGLTYSF